MVIRCSVSRSWVIKPGQDQFPTRSEATQNSKITTNPLYARPLHLPFIHPPLSLRGAGFASLDLSVIVPDDFPMCYIG